VKEVVVSAERIGNEVVVVVVPNHVCVLKNIQPRVLLNAALLWRQKETTRNILSTPLLRARCGRRGG